MPRRTPLPPGSARLQPSISHPAGASLPPHAALYLYRRTVYAQGSPFPAATPKCYTFSAARRFALRCKTMMEPALNSPPADVKSRFAPVYDVLNGAIAAQTFPGCAFGVFAGGAVVLQDGLGRFTYDDDANAVTPTTVYDVASITKV